MSLQTVTQARSEHALPSSDSDWGEKRLGDVLTLKRGYDLPESKRTPGDIPVVSSSGITGSHSVPKVDGPGVVTGRYGTLGEVFYVEKDFWPLNTALYVQDFKDHDARFIAYYLRFVFRKLTSDKSAVPGVNRNDLHARSYVFPPKKFHSQIVSILCAYDDLIENNRRRIALLDEAARLLYREWFVYLRFPGHEHVRMADGLPEGWAKAQLSALCSDVRDSVQPENVEPHTPYIGLEHLPRRSIALSEWGSAEDVNSSKFLYQENDILFGKIRPYFHKVGFAFNKGVTSSDAIVIRPRSDRWWPYVLALVSSDQFVALASKTVKEGSKMPRADWKYLSRCEFPLPPDSILSTFNDAIDPLAKQIRALALQMRALREARDLLLPRLMNGEVSV